MLGIYFLLCVCTAFDTDFLLNTLSHIIDVVCTIEWSGDFPVGDAW